MLEIDREQYAREVEAAMARGEKVEPLPPPYTSLAIRLEMGKELLFLTPPAVLALVGLGLALGPMAGTWTMWAETYWFTGLMGSLWGALIGAFVVWFFRIAGTLAFGRVAMGLGDVHLMFGVGAVIGAFGATIAFFLAPFFAILLHVYFWLVRGKRELPYGPYLSLATAFVLCYGCQIADYLTPGGEGFIIVLRQMFGGTSP
jgi:leader peptidase (prepilin peptidase)/N-methyltransferase